MAKLVNQPMREPGLLSDSWNALSKIARVRGPSAGRGEHGVLVVAPDVATKYFLSLMVATMTVKL